MTIRKLKNILKNVFQPSVNQALVEYFTDIEDRLVDIEDGESSLETVLTDETAVTLDFVTNGFHDLTLADDDITLNATVDGLVVGQKVFLKITQDATAAREITWGTGILTDVTVTASTDAIDFLVGVFDGTNIIFGALAQDVS